VTLLPCSPAWAYRTTCEHDPHWYQVARERFKDAPNVRVLKYENEGPLPPIEGMDERFDVGFVDSPQGYGQKRKVLPGCEDCNRLNTTLYALNRCKVVYLHDIHRELEWATLGRLNRHGYRVETSGAKFARILPHP
jgi:hypothetical protein